jgi:hypothetical protein
MSLFRGKGEKIPYLISPIKHRPWDDEARDHKEDLNPIVAVAKNEKKPFI